MRLSWIIPALLISVVGCSKSASEEVAEANQKALTVTTPNATAEDQQRNLAKSDMPADVKAVLGGAGK